ncbi:hypothetical protein Tco_1553539 [Tanacetum coccineum]
MYEIHGMTRLRYLMRKIEGGSSSSGINNEEEEIFDHDMHGLLNDILHPTAPQQSISSSLIGASEVQMGESKSNTSQGVTNGRNKFQDLLKDAEEKVYSKSKWKVTEGNSQVEMSQPKKKASKILRRFPLKPRLQRLFESSMTAAFMEWHHEEHVKDGKIQHPADALAWKFFDQKFPDFASDPRNVRLALASDGFNPFKIRNVAHSIWHVVLIPYNLPPWLVMKQPNFILSLIILGLRGPGNKIDVYMQPLIKELMELWKDGVETFSSDVRSFVGREEMRVAPIPSIGEEDLLTLKSYVHNRAHPEGSIAQGESYASSRDRSPVEGVMNYYGKLKDIIELNYSGKIRVVLFRGGWVDINRGCKKDKFGSTLVNFSYLSHSGANLLDNPFVFGSQVDKVFYCEDPKNKGWSVARHIKLKDVFDMGSDTAQSVDQDQSDGTFNVSHLHRIGDDSDDGEDVTSDIEHNGTGDEEDEAE